MTTAERCEQSWGAYWTRDRIRYALRNGYTPLALGGMYLGAGSCRLAWRLGAFVVKSDRDPQQPEHWGAERTEECRSTGRSAGFRLAPHVRVNGWILQRYYPPLESRGELPAEIQCLGFDFARDHRGRLVAFDW